MRNVRQSTTCSAAFSSIRDTPLARPAHAPRYPRRGVVRVSRLAQPPLWAIGFTRLFVRLLAAMALSLPVKDIGFKYLASMQILARSFGIHSPPAARLLATSATSTLAVPSAHPRLGFRRKENPPTEEEIFAPRRKENPPKNRWIPNRPNI